MKWIDVGAVQLERAAQHDSRRDAIDVVVAVNGDAFVAGDRLKNPFDRARHVGERAWGRADDPAEGPESAMPPPDRRVRADTGDVQPPG